jgi:type I restriction enzyme S subunit
MATGTSPSMKNLSIEEMTNLLVPVPPLAEQKHIYELLELQDKSMIPLRHQLLKSLQLLREHRAALITAAVTGQIPIEEIAA